MSLVIGKGGTEEEMEKGEGDKGSPSCRSPSRSPAYSPTLSDTRIRSQRASTSRSPDHVPSHDERDGNQQRRSMSIDSTDSRNGKRKARSFTSSRSDSRDQSLNSIEIKGLTKMVYATHLEQIFAAYGHIEEIFMPSDPYSEYLLKYMCSTYTYTLPPFLS